MPAVRSSVAVRARDALSAHAILRDAGLEVSIQAARPHEPWRQIEMWGTELPAAVAELRRRRIRHVALAPGSEFILRVVDKTADRWFGDLRCRVDLWVPQRRSLSFTILNQPGRQGRRLERIVGAKVRPADVDLAAAGGPTILHRTETGESVRLRAIRENH